MKPRPPSAHRIPGPSVRSAFILGLAALGAGFVAGCGFPSDHVRVTARNFEVSRTTPDAPEGVAKNLKQIGLVDGSVSFINDQSAPTTTAGPAPSAGEGQAFLTPSDSSRSTSPAANAPAEAAQASERERPPARPRKIIYDARIDLLVESVNSTEQAILKLVKDHEGFLAESGQSGQIHEQRRGTWRVRVPVDHFDAFVGAVSRLGEVRQSHVGSQDVTEEYVDLGARLRNKQEEEKRLLKHLADSTGKLEDILNVERELSRVRSEVEQMQGRLQFLSNRAALSTVTIEAIEWKNYTAPVPTTLRTQIGHTFFGSLESLVAVGKALLLVLVALVPWLPLIVLGLLLVRWLIRSGQRLMASRPPGVAPAPPSAS